MSEFYYWGKNTIGPILTLYIHLFITEIQKEEIERFYFVARDGFILQKIFNILSDKIYSGSTRFSELYLHKQIYEFYFLHKKFLQKGIRTGYVQR